jgi:hypothetical protein
MESKNNLCIIFVQNYKGKRLLIRSRGTCEKILKWALKISAWEGLGWIRLAQDWDKWRTHVNTSFIKWAAKWCGPVDTLPADACAITKQETLRIPTKPHACMSTPWSLGNRYTAKSCKGGERFPGALKWGPVRAQGEHTDRETSILQDFLGLV